MSFAEHKQIVLDDILNYGSADRSDPVVVFELLALIVRARRLGIIDPVLVEVDAWIEANPNAAKHALSKIDVESIFETAGNIIVCEEPEPEELLDHLFDVDLLLCALERGGEEETYSNIINGFAIHFESLPEELLCLKSIAKRFLEWNGGADAGGGNPVWVSLANAKPEDLSEPLSSEVAAEQETPEWLSAMLDAEFNRSLN